MSENSGNISGKPKISVISFCLNSVKYLRETIGSVLNQSYTDYEFIIKDGGSTDGTIDILKEYPQIRWISEKESGDNPCHEALWQAFHLSSGDYIVYLAISDNISDPNWFLRASAVLDSDPEVSWVWGLKQTKYENGHLGKISYQEYLDYPPPQKMEWLPFWFALQHAEETNAIFRRSLFEKYFPKNDSSDPYRFNGSLGFNLRLNMAGHLPLFLPIISFYGYIHENQLQQRFPERLESIAAKYRRDVVDYRKKFLSGEIRHRFRDGFSNVIHEVGKDELRKYSKKVLTYRIKYKLRRELQKLMDHIVY